MNTYSYEIFLINSDGVEVRFTWGKGKSALEIAAIMTQNLLMNEEEAKSDKPFSVQLTRFSVTQDSYEGGFRVS